MNKITFNSVISILFIASTLLFAKTIEPSENIDENDILNNIDTNSMAKDWNDYQMNDNNIEQENKSKLEFVYNISIIGQPACSIEPSN